MKKFLLAALLLCLCAQAQAAEVAGIRLEDGIHLGSGDLVLNGAGVRTKWFFKVYVAALYLVKKDTVAKAVLADENPQRVALHMLRDLTDEQLLSPVMEAIAANHSTAEMTALELPLRRMMEIFHLVKEVRQGDILTLDYLPGSGTLIGVNGSIRGTVSGEMFHRALMKIWLGENPVQDDLKRELLGGR